VPGGTARATGASGGGCSRNRQGAANLRELVRTNDVVLVSAIGALLDGANIGHLVLDQNMSILEGSVGVIPRRILVHDDDNRAARQVLTDAGLAHELRADD
jgi:Putative prokaryotic signal transducing protein